MLSLSLSLSPSLPPSLPPPSLSLSQVNQVLYKMESGLSELKSHIDQLLVVVLNRDPELLQGMPRVQQDRCMRPELRKLASIHEVHM